MAIKIYVGSLDNPLYVFDPKDDPECILESKSVQKVSLAGKELTIDTFEPVVQDKIENLIDVYHFRSNDGREIETATGEIYAIDVDDAVHASELISLEYGTPVWYYRDNDLVGKFYVSNVDRIGRNKYRISCVSVIGLLDKMYHGGGLFVASTFQTVLNHILAEDEHGTGSPVIDYAIDQDVADLPVSGWLPRDTKRNNLYQLVFSNGVNIIKNMDGVPRFTFIYTASQAGTEIQTAEIYDTGSVKYEKPYSSVSVYEHTFSALLDESPVTLFDNTDGELVVGEEIWFNNAPIIVDSITADGLTLESATENSAIVTGNGRLTGIPYTHTTRILTSTKSGGDKDKTATVKNCTLVNTINSNNLLLRLAAYYQPDGMIRTIQNSIVYKDQRCGRAYSFKNPFEEDETAYLATMNITASEIFKADCEWRANYEPAGQQGLYKHCIILDADTFAEDGGTFTVPAEVLEQENPQIRVVIIGGGTGGGSGWPGENGDDARTYTNVATDGDISGMWYGAEGGDGGQGGTGGAPGRVYSVVIENPSATYNYTIGDGGDGGAATGFIPDTVDELREALENENPSGSWTDEEIEAMIAQENTNWNGSPNSGTAGTASTFGSYSSNDDGSYTPTGGVYEPITGRFFAFKGNSGIRGGKGGARHISSGMTYNWVTDGEDVRGADGTVYHGGRTGRPYTSVPGLPEANLIAYGGNGAGAAVGLDRADHPHMDGGSDQSASWEVTTD